MTLRSIILALSLLAVPTVAVAGASPCPQFFPAGQPPVLLDPRLGQRATLLCNDGFAVLASGVTHGALWSAERLSRAGIEAARTLPREGRFHAEDRLPIADRAQLEDYRRSGYDRGHMTPSGDQPDATAQEQTFSLANMVPQTEELNRGVWSKIETAIRSLAVRRGELFAVTGPAFVGSQISAIGPDGVLVPTSTWKAVYDPVSGAAGAYVCSNVAAPRCAVTSVATLVDEVGIDPFPALPAPAKSQAMALPEPGGIGKLPKVTSVVACRQADRSIQYLVRNDDDQAHALRGRRGLGVGRQADR